MKVNLSWMRATLSGAASFQYHLNSGILSEWSWWREKRWIGDVQGREKSLILACECARVQLAEVRAAVLGPWLAQQLV